MCEQKVSIIIPAFNAEKTIRATILSVLSQTYKNIELIVINDGSQDNTIAITSQIWDPRLQIFSFENAGANIARNRGLSMAKGEYVSFIDADDLWSPRKIECQVMALQQSVDADVAYSWTDYIDQSGNFICSGIQSKFSGNVYKRLFISNFIENGSNILVRRHSLVKIGGFSESLEGAQDWDCCLRLARQYSFVFVPEIHVFYRQSSHSISSNLVRNEQQCLLVINQFLHDTPDILKPVENLSLSNLYLYL